MSELSDYIAANKPAWDAKDARIAELTRLLRALADEFESVTRNSEHHFAYRQARAAIASVEGKTNE